MPITPMVRCAAPTSSMASRMARSATGSPHPGQRLCSATSSSVGPKSSTRCAGSTGGCAVGRYRSAIETPRFEDSQKSFAHVVAVEIGRDAEPGAVEAEPPDELHRDGTREGEADVVDHLPLAVLVHRDRAGSLRRVRQDLTRE